MQSESISMIIEKIKPGSMKKILTLSVLTIGLVVLFTGCYQDRQYVDDSYWLTKERGQVVYSDPYCQAYVVETNYGYAVLRAFDGYKPFEGAIVYGNFSSYGIRDFYNRTNGIVFTAEVTEYWLSWFEAQDALSYYCY